MYQHPAAAIQQARINFEYGNQKPISLNIRPQDYTSYIQKDINDRIAQFNCLTDASIKKNNLENDSLIKTFQENARRDILLSALDKSFKEKYEELKTQHLQHRGANNTPQSN